MKLWNDFLDSLASPGGRIVSLFGLLLFITVVDLAYPAEAVDDKYYALVIGVLIAHLQPPQAK